MPRVSLKQLTWIFLRVGSLTFGGGDPTMAALQSELVVTRGWLTGEQYALIYGLARITPGTNLVAFSARRRDGSWRTPCSPCRHDRSFVNRRSAADGRLSGLNSTYSLWRRSVAL
jgi:hypothetical protein